MTLPSKNRLPADIRKSCMILGLSPDEFTVASVNAAWKKQVAIDLAEIAVEGVAEMVLMLTLAKDRLLGWIEENGDDFNESSGVPRKRLPGDGSSSVVLPLPKQKDVT